MRASGFERASSGEAMVASGSYRTSTRRAASSAESSSTATTAATGSPTNRTLSAQRACSSCETGRIPKATGKSTPVRTARTPSADRAAVESTPRMRACGTVERTSFMCCMPGKERSSANRVSPVTFPRASMRRSGLPTGPDGRGIPPAGAMGPGSAGPGIGGPPVHGGEQGRGGSLAPEHPASRLDRLVDLLVSGASAQLARERLRDLLPGGVRLPVEDPSRGHQHARRAVAALGRAMVGEGGLEGMELGAVPEPLHGGDRSIAALHRRHQAGERQIAVEEDGAGAALAELAPVLGTGQSQVLAEHLEERLVRVDEDLAPLVVHGEYEAELAARSDLRDGEGGFQEVKQYQISVDRGNRAGAAGTALRRATICSPVPDQVVDQGGAVEAVGLLAGVEGHVAAEVVDGLCPAAEGAAVGGEAGRAGAAQVGGAPLDRRLHLRLPVHHLVAEELPRRALGRELAVEEDSLPRRPLSHEAGEA